MARAGGAGPRAYRFHGSALLGGVPGAPLVPFVHERATRGRAADGPEGARSSGDTVGARREDLRYCARMRVCRLLASAILLSSCAEPYLLTDGTSVSAGRDNGGILRHAAELPAHGDGYVIRNTWVARHSNYGTDELVAAVVWTCRRVAMEYPGSIAGVADLSHLGGGETSEHHSHETGRDVDIVYYADDGEGHYLPPPDTMVPYRSDGWSVPTVGPTGFIASRHFDAARNWAMIRAWLEDPTVDVQWIFVQRALRRRLLDWAVAHGEPPTLIERAAYLLRQPGDSMPHDDHMHVRIFCPLGDTTEGCIDIGPYRWAKKLEKYGGRYRARRGPDVTATLSSMGVSPLGDLAVFPE